MAEVTALTTEPQPLPKGPKLGLENCLSFKARVVIYEYRAL